MEPVKLIKSNWNKRKYKPGALITYLGEIPVCVQKNIWIYLHGVPKHPMIIENMSLGTVYRYIVKGMLRRADLNTETQ